jgi:dTDP-4-amino-4,6-dideoxygalactose transaminase
VRFLKVFQRLLRNHGWAHALRYLSNYMVIRRRAKWPVYGNKEMQYLSQVLRSGHWGGVPFPNKFAAEFTRKFTAMHTAQHGICTSNGSTALHVAFQAAGLKAGDEIIVPALTFAASASAGLEQGIIPVFVDVDPQTMCIDPEAVRKAITSKTRAIVPVHLGAQMADMDAILTIAREHKLRVIEDCAHAHGAMWGDRGAGSLGDMGCFSFQSTKLLTAGEGGMIITNDEELAARCESYVNFGRDAAGGEQTLLGSNYRMTEFQTAVLLAQFERFPEQARRRNDNVRLFTRLLNDVTGVTTLQPYEKVVSQSAYGYYFRYMSESCGGVDRGRFIKDLLDQGIPAIEDMYVPVYRSPNFGWRDAPADVNFENAACPVADKAAADELVWIQHRIFLTGPRQMEWMASIIKWLLNGYRKSSS